MDRPIVADIKRRAQEAIDSPKNANNIVELIGYLDTSEPSYTVIAAINGLKRIFVGLLEKRMIERKDERVSAGDKYRAWLSERHEEYVKGLCSVCHHAKTSVVSLAVASLFNLIVTRHKVAAPPEGLAGWHEEEVKVGILTHSGWG